LPGGWGACLALALPRSRRAEIFRCGVPGPLHPPHPALPTPEPPRSPRQRPGSLIRPRSRRRRDSAARGGAPQRPHTPASPWPPETMATPPARRIEYPPTKKHRSDLSSSTLLSGRVGGENRPAGHRSHLACGCGDRAGASRWGVAGAVSCEQRGTPPRGVPARSHAQAGRRAGLDAQPERPLMARGAKEKPSRSRTRRRGIGAEPRERVSPSGSVRR
jgi:hypothetical protein